MVMLFLNLYVDFMEVELAKMGCLLLGLDAGCWMLGMDVGCFINAVIKDRMLAVTFCPDML